MSDDPTLLTRDIRRTLAAGTAAREFERFVAPRLPRLQMDLDAGRWLEHAERVRSRLIALLLRGHPHGILTARFPVQWTATLEPGPGYRIRKLRYEGYPGLWVPALLYEPVHAGPRRAARSMPAVLNPGGHHLGGTAMAYQQARCINLAKRGMLALSFEFLGMGELAGSRQHNRLAHLGLTGLEGAGLFFLAMKRALDVLLSHPRADQTRVAMTGLSGGGWQTVLLSALDSRITASIPVAGHTAVWQRMAYPADWGDLEQEPSDLCTVADYDTLSALIAPRPVLFIYNHDDDCCFPTARARVSVLGPARRIYQLLGADDHMESYDNRVPGTHNYERDNRERLYAFLDRRFGLRTARSDLPWQAELLSEREAAVGLPPDNATLLSIALARAHSIARARSSHGVAPAPQDRAPRQRATLRRLLRVSELSVLTVTTAKRRNAPGATLVQSVARLDAGWSIPLADLRPRSAAVRRAAAAREGGAELQFTGGEQVLSVSDFGLRSALAGALRRCAPPGPTPARVVAVDVFGTGELAQPWQRHMLMAAAGERSLGLQASQILAVARWMRTVLRAPKVSLQASGPCLSVAALVAVAVAPTLFRDLVTDSLLPSLACLLDWPVNYEEAPSLFAFGLLELFDVPGLLQLCRPVSVRDANRGPLG